MDKIKLLSINSGLLYLTVHAFSYVTHVNLKLVGGSLRVLRLLPSLKLVAMV